MRINCIQNNIFISNHYLYVINFVMILSKINYFNANLIFNFLEFLAIKILKCITIRILDNLGFKQLILSIKV